MTPGQQVYEHYNPPFGRVIPASCHFPTAADVRSVKNDNHVPYRFLTQKCRDKWEQYAVGHHIFSAVK